MLNVARVPWDAFACGRIHLAHGTRDFAMGALVPMNGALRALAKLPNLVGLVLVQRAAVVSASPKVGEISKERCATHQRTRGALRGRTWIA